MMHTAVLKVCSPQTEIVKCFIWRGFVSSNYFINLHQLQEWLTLSSRSLKMLIIRKLLMEDIEPLTYLMVSAVKTFSPTAIRFSNLLSLGNVLAIHSFWSMNWGEGEDTFWSCTKTTKHRKNCECCHHRSLFKGHNVIVYIVVLNCQIYNQCLKCHVSGHKNFQKLWKLPKNLKH